MSSQTGPKPAADIAYLINQYPKVSHSFIRREIRALETLGLKIFRVSIRGWNIDLVDPADVAEREKTTYVLEAGAASLAMAVFVLALRSPIRLVLTLGLTKRMMRRSDRPFLWHLFYLAEACWIVLLLEKQNIRHLHAHFGTNSAEVAMLVSELTDITYSFTVHGPEEFDKRLSLHLKDKIERASFVVAISSFCKSQLLRIVDYANWDKIKIVHCGVDAEFGQINDVVPAPVDRLVCVGRLCEQKGQLLLVEAMAEIVKEFHSCELVLVGDGEDRAAIEQLVAEKGLGAHVRITGWATAAEVKREILSARALVMPSFAEGLPVVLMEAMVLGRPVLSTYVAGIPELVEHGSAGWLFPAGSKEQMLDAIRECLNTPKDSLKKMGEFGRARALQRHDQLREAHKLAALFKMHWSGGDKICSP